MYLNVILTIFVILQLTMIILAYKFWKKYGKQMFNTYMEMKKSSKFSSNVLDSQDDNVVSGTGSNQCFVL